MTLDDYMIKEKLTDQEFGDRIGKSRMQVFRYRHGLQVPGKKTMPVIIEKTCGRVPPSSFYPAQADHP